MAEFEVYGDLFDCNAFAEAILASPEYHLIPNICYEHPTATAIKSAGIEFASYLKTNRMMFVAGAFTRELSWQKLSSGGWAGHHVIRPEYDGPVLTFRFPIVSDRQDGAIGSAGSFGYRARMYSSKLGIEVPIASEAKAAFRELVAKIKSQCTYVSLGAGKAWIGRNLLNRASQPVAPKLIVNGIQVPLPSPSPLRSA